MPFRNPMHPLKRGEGLTRVERLTHAERHAYALRLREFAERMREEGDLKSAELNDWMAGNYAQQDSCESSNPATVP